MKRIKVLGSSSKGNCYLVEGFGENLLLEAGIAITKIKKQLSKEFPEITSCLITHEHKDHSKSAQEIAALGIDMYMSEGTRKMIDLDSHRVKIVKDRYKFETKEFSILAFNTQHDAAEPMGFLIQNKISKEKLLFATDTYYLRYRFQGLTHIMVEANYCLDIMDKNVAEGKINEYTRNRIIRSHFEIDHVVGFLQANDLSRVKNIVLLHLSDNNSDEALFRDKIQKAVGMEPIIARPGVEIALI